MHQEKYSLTWHTYSDHLRSMMRELMMNEDFSDVTLVTEDKKHIKANINILSACSPVFKDILKKEKNTNQIMYLRGVQFSEMESIMQFIYLGEASLYEERMDDFIAVAKSLEIKGLCNAETETNDEPEDGKMPIETFSEAIVEQTDDRTKQERRALISTNSNGRYECEKCHKTYTCSTSLYTHKQSAHEGVKYACDQCDYQGSVKSDLRRHIQSIHEGIKYGCDQCDYQARRKDHLNLHIKSKHEGVKYACDHCDYQSTQKSHLNTHIRNKH